MHKFFSFVVHYDQVTTPYSYLQIHKVPESVFSNDRDQSASLGICLFSRFGVKSN